MSIFKFFKSFGNREPVPSGSLTPKQEKFSMLVSNGRNHTEAYRETYITKNMGANSIYREAYQLTQNPKVVALSLIHI